MLKKISKSTEESQAERQGEGDHLPARARIVRRNNSANILILDFPASRSMKINFCCLSKIKQKVKFVVSNPHS
jgi:hypothetical protein